MDPIKGVNGHKTVHLEGPGKDADASGDFSKVLKDTIEKIDALQKEADRAIQDFSVGKASLHETMIAIEKANLSFQLMVQVKNKIVTAYEDIMRMQV